MKRCPRCGDNVFMHEPGEESCVHCGEIWHAEWWLIAELFLEVLDILEEREEGRTQRVLHHARHGGGGRRKVVAAA